MNTKPVPIFIVLLAAAISCVISVMQGQDFGTFFFRLLQAVVIFSVVGFIVKFFLDLVFNKRVVEEEEEEEKQEDSEDDTEENSEYDSEGYEPGRNPDEIEMEPGEDDFRDDFE